MSTLDQQLLSTDLDFLIRETGRQFTGVSPVAIKDKVFVGSISAIEDGYDVMINGHEVKLDAEIIINRTAYDTAPSKGSVIEDSDGTKHKVLDVLKTDPGPVLRLQVVSQYSRG